jgi:hypothetical protein
VDVAVAELRDLRHDLDQARDTGGEPNDLRHREGVPDKNAPERGSLSLLTLDLYTLSEKAAEIFMR